jgi:hypothetical protein
MKILSFLICLAVCGCSLYPPALTSVKSATVREHGAAYLDRVVLSIHEGYINVNNDLLLIKPILLSLVSGTPIRKSVTTISGIELELEFLLDDEGIIVNYMNLTSLISRDDSWGEGSSIEIDVLGSYPRIIFRDVRAYIRIDHGLPSAVATAQ